MESSEDISFLSDGYKTLFELVERNKIKLGRMNKWIEALRLQLIIKKKRKSNQLLFLIWIISRSN